MSEMDPGQCFQVGQQRQQEQPNRHEQEPQPNEEKCFNIRQKTEMFEKKTYNANKFGQSTFRNTVTFTRQDELKH